MVIEAFSGCRSDSLSLPETPKQILYLTPFMWPDSFLLLHIMELVAYQFRSKRSPQPHPGRIVTVKVPRHSPFPTAPIASDELASLIHRRHPNWGQEPKQTLAKREISASTPRLRSCPNRRGSCSWQDSPCRWVLSFNATDSKSMQIEVA